MPLNVAFLWHMHQPLYLDPFDSKFIMPWVRLHGVKAYSDMLYVAEDIGEKSQDFGVTFNLVPSLIYQIRQYETIEDTFFTLSKPHPSALRA